MSHIPMTAAGNDSPRLRLQRMARWMRVLIAFGAVVLLIGAATWLTSESKLDPWTRDVMRTTGMAHDVDPTGATLAGVVAVGMVNVLMALFTLLQVWHLFGAYGQGDVFGPLAVRCIRRLAWALIATSAWHSISYTMDVLLLTWQRAPGQRMLMFGISWEDYVGTLVGVLLLAMAWAMTEARRLEQDNASFV